MHRSRKSAQAHEGDSGEAACISGLGELTAGTAFTGVVGGRTSARVAGSGVAVACTGVAAVSAGAGAAVSGASAAGAGVARVGAGVAAAGAGVAAVAGIAATPTRTAIRRLPVGIGQGGRSARSRRA